MTDESHAFDGLFANLRANMVADITEQIFAPNLILETLREYEQNAHIGPLHHPDRGDFYAIQLDDFMSELAELRDRWAGVQFYGDDGGEVFAEMGSQVRRVDNEWFV